MPKSKWGREHPDEIDTPEGAEFVAAVDAGEHGYWGVRQDDTPRHEYTVAGVTGNAESGGGGAHERSASRKVKSEEGSS